MRCFCDSGYYAHLFALLNCSILVAANPLSAVATFLAQRPLGADWLEAKLTLGRLHQTTMAIAWPKACLRRARLGDLG